MRITTFKVILLVQLIFALNAYSLDLTEHEKTCQEIGFKKKTQAFGECVLELDSRNTQSSNSLMDDESETCKKFGFKQQSANFAECRLKLSLAKAEGERAQQNYDREKAAYERQMAAIEKERDRQRAMRQLELGLRMMGGQSPVNAMNSIGTNAPIAPTTPMPINQTITTPSGRMITCTTMGTMTNCN